MAHVEEDHIEATPVESRQGFLDRPVLVVLALSTGLAALAMAAFFFGSALG